MSTNKDKDFLNNEYKYDFKDQAKVIYSTGKGLNEEVSERFLNLNMNRNG